MTMKRILITLPAHIDVREAENAITDTLAKRFRWTHGELVIDSDPCLCDPDMGAGPCVACVERADALVGARVRDSHDREWTVEHTDEKNNMATVGGGHCWAYAHDVTVLS